MIEKTFLNPATNKQWRIEIDGHTVRTCLNGGKVKEILCDSAFQVKSKAASAMMGQMRKGFVYQNPDAAVGQARCHRFVGKDSNGFMPLAAALTRDDFFLTRVAGDFEDETLYHFDGSGEILETVSLGAKRMTYEQVLCPNDTLLLNNSYLLQQFSLRTHEITPFANKKNSMKAMLDASGDLDLMFRAGAPTETQRSIVSHWAHEIDLDTMKKGLETGQALQALPLRWLGLRPDADNSEAEIPMYYGTTSEGVGCDSGGDAGVNGYIRTSRKLALDYLKQHQSPSYAQMTLPLMPQFRMTRRLVGKEQLEVVPNRYVESSIGCMIHSLEIPAEVYEFPYGGLIDTEITNIAAAGRIVSATGRGWEVARFIPACVLTGEAAGLAVSMAAKENISLQALDVPALQHTLASRGVKIHMDEALRRNRRPQPGEKKDPKKTDATSVVRADSLSYRH